MGPGGRRAALLLIAVVSVNASYTVLIPFVPTLEERVGSGPAVIALTFALFAAAKMLAQPLGGWWVDRSRAGHVALLSLLVASMGIVLTALARDSVTLLTGRILWGVGEGLVSPALYAGLSGLCREYGIPSSRMMGSFGSASVGGLLLGPLVAGVAAPVGIEGLFLAGAAVTVITAFGLLYAIPASGRARPEEPVLEAFATEVASGAGPVRWWAGVLVLGGLDMFTFLIYSALEPVLPLYLSSHYGPSARGAISVVFVVGLATSGLSMWLLGRYTERVQLVTLVKVALPVLGIGLTGMAISPDAVVVAAWFVVFMVGHALLFLTARRGILELQAATKHQGKAFGLFGMVSDVGNIVGPILGVLLYDRTGRASFVCLGALSGVLLVAVGRGKRVLASAGATAGATASRDTPPAGVTGCGGPIGAAPRVDDSEATTSDPGLAAPAHM